MSWVIDIKTTLKVYSNSDSTDYQHRQSDIKHCKQTDNSAYLRNCNIQTLEIKMEIRVYLQPKQFGKGDDK